MAEGINQVLTIPSNVVAIAQVAQSLRPKFEEQGATEMATINGTNFNDNGIEKSMLIGTAPLLIEVPNIPPILIMVSTNQS